MRLFALNNQNLSLRNPALFFFASQIVYQGLNLLLLKKLLNTFSSTEFGRYSLSLTLIGIVVQIIFVDFTPGFLRVYHSSTIENKTSIFFKATLPYIFRFTAIFSFFSVISSFFLSSYLRLSVFETIAILIFAGFSSIVDLFISLLNIEKKRTNYIFFQLSNVCLKLGTIFFLSSMFQLTLFSFFFFSILIQLVLLFSLCKLFEIELSFFITGYQNFENSILKQIRGISRPYLLWGIFSWFHLYFDRWVISFFFSLSLLGKFQFLMQVGYSTILVLSQVYTNYILPNLFKRFSELGPKEAFRLNMNYAYLFSVFIFLIFLVSILCGDYFLSLFVAPDSFEFGWLLPYIVLAGGLFGLSQIIALQFYTTLQLKKQITIKIITALFGILSLFVFVIIFGLPGAVYSSLLYSIFTLVFVYSVAKNI